ncbi:MAG: CspA family cold shock protein [Bermanella sp.]|jgi:CspA family cold shock protein
MVFFIKLATALLLAATATVITQISTGAELLGAASLGLLLGYFLVSLASFLFSPWLPSMLEKLTPQRETGKVKWFNTNKGYGFITRENGDDVFVHFRSIRGKGRRSLIEGESVQFVLAQGEKGAQAEDVRTSSSE